MKNTNRSFLFSSLRLPFLGTKIASADVTFKEKNNIKNKIQVRFVAVSALTLLIATQAYSQVSIRGLGATSNGGIVPGFYTQSQAISRDGRVVVGRRITGIAGSSGNAESYASEAFRWTEGTGLVSLGDLPGGSPIITYYSGGVDINSVAYGVSDDGNVIGGVGLSAAGFEAFRWTPSTGMVGLGDLPGGTATYGYGTTTGDTDSSIGVVSGDGNVLAGGGLGQTATGGNLTAGIRWTQATGLTALPVPSYLNNNTVTMVGSSQDGSVLVGESSQQGFIWNATTGATVLPGTSFMGNVSSDGSTVVGMLSANVATGLGEGYRWTSATGVTSIGFLPRFGSTYDLVQPKSISDSGIIVGYQYGSALPVGATIASNDRAFIWMEGAGMLDLREMLVTSGVDMSGWALLTRATDISADGTTITGNGIRQNGLPEAFVLRNDIGTAGWRLLSSTTAPEPGTLSLLVMGALAPLLRRRKKN
jgi:probable HAF family extracellular repeat protein